MKKRKTTRRRFIGEVGATALGGMCGLSLLGCKEGAAAEIKLRLRSGPDLLEVPEAVFRPTGSGATIHWVPQGNVESQILAGTAANELRVVRELSSDKPVEVELTGFKASSDVFWQCQHRRPGDTQWATSPVQQYRTRRKQGESFRVALFADSHYYKASHLPRRAKHIADGLEAVRADRPDFGVFLGDEAGVHFMVDSMAERSFALARQRWQNWRRFASPLLSSVPTFMVLGNHEGEAGFYQDMDRQGKAFLQRWGTISRKRYYLNPLPSTYQEGGENAQWRGDQRQEMTGGAAEGNCSPLQNYFAWTWGDALFVVLDVHRYTNIGKGPPSRPEDWTLGRTQQRWFQNVLEKSTSRWKFVIAHHLVGGSPWDLSCRKIPTDYAYGRGGARYARVGEQARITDIMKRTGAQFFLYGHDHIYAHQEAEGLHFVCCGRPTKVTQWAQKEGFVEAYGDYRDRNPHAFIMDLGYTRLTVDAHRVCFEYVKTGVDSQGGENTEGKVGDVLHRFEVT